MSLMITLMYVMSRIKDIRAKRVLSTPTGRTEPSFFCSMRLDKKGRKRKALERYERLKKERKGDCILHCRQPGKRRSRDERKILYIERNAAHYRQSSFELQGAPAKSRIRTDVQSGITFIRTRIWATVGVPRLQGRMSFKAFEGDLPRNTDVDVLFLLGFNTQSINFFAHRFIDETSTVHRSVFEIEIVCNRWICQGG